MNRKTQYNNNQKQNNKLTKTKLGLTLFVIFCTQLLLLTFNILPFLTTIILGGLGLSSYVILLMLSVLSLFMYFEKKIMTDGKQLALMFLWFFVFALILHLTTTLNVLNESFSEHVTYVYGLKNTFGGVLLSLIVYPLNMLTHTIASYVLLAVLLIAITCGIIIRIYYRKNNVHSSVVKKESKSEAKLVRKTDYNALTDQSEYEEKTPEPQKVSDADIFISDDSYNKKYGKAAQAIDELVQSDAESAPKPEKSKAKSILGLSPEERDTNRNILSNSSNIKISSYNSAKENNISKKDYILQPKMPNEDKTISQKNNVTIQNEETGRPRKFVHGENTNSGNSQPVFDNKKELSESDKKNLEFLRNSLGGDLRKRPNKASGAPERAKQQPVSDNLLKQENDFEYEDYINNQIYDSTLTQKNYKQKVSSDDNKFASSSDNGNYQSDKLGHDFDSTNQFNDHGYDDFVSDDGYENNNKFSEFNGKSQSRPTMNFEDGTNSVSVSQNKFTTNDINSFTKKEFVKPQIEAKEVSKPKPRRNTKYNRPPIDLLKVYESKDSVDSHDYEQKALMLEETLASFKINAKVVSVTKGPAFTRFELQMPQGIAVKRVTSYIDDIAMVLQSHGAIRVEIPIPGKNAFGVEVPNESIATVGLKDVLESYSFQSSKPLLTFALGKDITGESKIARLDKMPHLLVAGSTGSGKSVALNALLISLIYKASPDDLRMILVDPKRVEFTLYNGLPHLLVPDVITDPDKAIKAMTWTIEEMERRFTKFSKYRVRNLEEYNETVEVQTGYEEKIPYLVLVIDELADLMSVSKKEIEEKIMRIAQKSRAAGIHLVLATQRPSVDVITGVIKSNLPSRIAFAVSSFADSKTIIDQSGAEKLLGKGDMLYYPNDVPDPIRIQGAFVSNKEVEDIVEYIKENNDVYFDDEIEDRMFNKKTAGFDGGMGQDEFDPIMKDALRAIIKTGGVSISKIQRMFGLGFQRAGKIVDQMERAGFVSEQDTNKTRQVFITQQEFEEKFGEDL